MHDFRLRLEKEILSWPGATTKKMYGCPCYKYKDKLFAFMVTDGVVLVKVNEVDRNKLSTEFEMKPFQAGEKRTMSLWPQIRIEKIADLERILPYIKNCYTSSKTSKE